MDKTITIRLTGHAETYELEEGAYDRLSRYLDGAAVRLLEDPDRAEVLADLERSIGDRLTALVGSEDRLIRVADIEAILAAIGVVDTGQDARSDAHEGRERPGGRRLQRIREGQQLAGVCNGLAVYSDIRVDWVRTLFVLATLATAGIFSLVYVALAFILPVVPTAADARR